MPSKTFLVSFAAVMIVSIFGYFALAQGSDQHHERQRWRKFSFAFIGDVPYTDLQIEKFDRLVEKVNADRAIRWVVHAGDIKAGSTPCDDATFVARFEQYQEFKRPFIITPGDNEWTDCHRVGAGQFNPIERLEKLRGIFYPRPGFSTGGQAMVVQTQAAFPGFETFVENVLWHHRGVIFATVHVVGSNNNLAPWSGIDPDDSFENPCAGRLAEFEAR